MENRLQQAIWYAADVCRSAGARPEESLVFVLSLLLHRLRSNGSDEQGPESARSWFDTSEFNEPERVVRRILSQVQKKWGIDVTVPALSREGLYQVLRAVDHVVGAEAKAKRDDSLNAGMFDLLSPEMGESHTPISVAMLMADLMGPTTRASVLDPCAGSGGLLGAALEHAKATTSAHELSIHGSERNTLLANVGKLRFAFAGLPTESFAIADAFDSSVAPGDVKYDWVISNPPMGVTTSSGEMMRLERNEIFRWGPPLRTMDFNFIQLALSRLKPGGKAMLLVRLTPLFTGGREGEIRKRLIVDGFVTAVVMLPSGLLPMTSAACAVLLLQNSSGLDRKKTIRFVAANSEFLVAERGRRILSDANIRRISEALRGESTVDGFARDVSLTEVEEQEWSLLPSRYLEADSGGISLGLNAPMRKLDDIADVLQGPSLANLPSGNEPILQGRDLSNDVIYREELPTCNVCSVSKPVLRIETGDVLVQRIGAGAVYYADKTLDGLATSDTVFVVRLRQRDPVFARFLVQYFKSESGRKQIAKVAPGAMVRTVSRPKLRQLKLPCPDVAVMKLSIELDDLERALSAQVDHASKLKARLFGAKDSEQFVTTFQDVRLNCQMLGESLQDTNDLVNQVRNHFPYLLAYPYRDIDTQSNPSIRYKSQLRYVENSMAYLACIGVALCQLQSDPAQTSELESLLDSSWEGGISPGSWKSIWQRTCLVLRENSEYPIAANFGASCFSGRGSKQSKLAALLEGFVGRINDDKHHRGPTVEREYETESETLGQQIAEYLGYLKFLIQTPMLRVLNCAPQWGIDRFTSTCVLYKGDHPSLSTTQLETKQALIPGHLYLRVGEDRFVSMYPLLSVHFSQKSRRDEVWVLDSLKRDRQQAKLRSMESAEVFDGKEAQQIATDLIRWRQAVGNRK